MLLAAVRDEAGLAVRERAEGAVAVNYSLQGFLNAQKEVQTAALQETHDEVELEQSPRLLRAQQPLEKARREVSQLNQCRRCGRFADLLGSHMADRRLD